MFGRQYKQESGAIVLDGKQIGTTRQCVHCGSHETIIGGSGKTRGFCTYCRGFLCGKQKCFQCIPFEARIEYMEAVNENKVSLINKLVSRYPGIQRAII